MNVDSETIDEFYRYYDDASKLIAELGATEVSSFRYVRNNKNQRIFKETDTKDIGKLKGMYDNTIVLHAFTIDVLSLR